MSSSGNIPDNIPDYNKRLLWIRERELEIREREIALRELELHVQDRSVQKFTPYSSQFTDTRTKPRKTRGQLDHARREPLHVLLLKTLKNGSYACSAIMLAATISAIFTAQPSGELTALGFTLVFALAFTGAIFHLALWNEGGRS